MLGREAAGSQPAARWQPVGSHGSDQRRKKKKITSSSEGDFSDISAFSHACQNSSMIIIYGSSRMIHSNTDLVLWDSVFLGVKHTRGK